MKLRLGFVSNSSSSSCIIAWSNITVNVTYDDIVEFLTELYSGARMQAHAEESRRLGRKEYPLWTVLDQSKAREDTDLQDQLDIWLSRDALLSSGGKACPSALASAACNDWREFVRKLDTYQNTRKFFKNGWESVYTTGTLRNIVECKNMYRYDKKTGKFHYKQYPAQLAKILIERWNRLGLCTGKAALLSPSMLACLHFADNEIYYVKGMTDDAGWETEPWSGNRFLEVLLSWLKDKGKVAGSVTVQEFRGSSVLFLNMHEG
jgi:hypothetical protein